MKKLLLLLAITALSHAAQNINAPKLTNPGQANPTVQEDKQNTELKARVLTTLAAAKPRILAAAKVGGSVLAMGYLGYTVFKLLHGAFLAGSNLKSYGLDYSPRAFRFDVNIEINIDKRMTVDNYTASHVVIAAGCGYVAYKFLEIARRNAPIVLNSK